MSETFEGESRLHDHVRELERELRARTPASKQDLDEIHVRLGKIEQSLATLARAARSTGDVLAELRDGEHASLVPATRPHESVHH